jgi:hypothetical protein
MTSASDLQIPKALPASLPLRSFGAGASWVRIHKSALDPVFFGPSAGGAPVSRFDAPAGEYRVLYLGLTFSAAFVETLIRLPQLPFIKRSVLEERSVSVLKNINTLRLVDLRGRGLSRIGADNRLTTGSHAVAGQWALELWRHPDNAAGILHRSRLDPTLECAAIFNRRLCRFSVETTDPLMSLAAQWVPTLRAHGKGIV